VAVATARACVVTQVVVVMVVGRWEGRGWEELSHVLPGPGRMDSILL
jgi:hypothetical protein